MSPDPTAPPSVPRRPVRTSPKQAVRPDPAATTGVDATAVAPGRPAEATAPAGKAAFPPVTTTAAQPSAGGSAGAVPGTVPGPELPPPAARTPVEPDEAAAAPRRVSLTVSRVDPWSVMKLSFLLSVAVGLMIVIGTAVVWLALDGMHVFATIEDLVTTILADSTVDVLQYLQFSRVISAATLVALLDVFLITALSTVIAALYNITASLVGGVHLTLTDE